MGESFQTYESHVPYNLQFLMDYNLFGMNLIHLESVKFRRTNAKLNLDESTTQTPFDYSKFQSNYLVNIDKKWEISTLPE